MAPLPYDPYLDLTRSAEEDLELDDLAGEELDEQAGADTIPGY